MRFGNATRHNAAGFKPVSLDALNFLLADVRGALGPYVNVFLITQQHWSQSAVGLMMTVGGLLGLALQTPIGAAIDATRAKRGVIVATLAVIAISAVTIAMVPRFWPVLAANSLMAIAGDVLGPAVASLTLGLLKPQHLARRMGRNSAFDHGGNVTIALIAGGVGWMLGQRSVFLLAPFFAALAAAVLPAAPAPPQAALWGTTEAPASCNIKLRVGNMEIWYTARDVDDATLQQRLHGVLPWLKDVLMACEADYAARVAYRGQRTDGGHDRALRDGIERDAVHARAAGDRRTVYHTVRRPVESIHVPADGDPQLGRARAELHTGHGPVEDGLHARRRDRLIRGDDAGIVDVALRCGRRALLRGVDEDVALLARRQHGAGSPYQ